MADNLYFQDEQGNVYHRDELDWSGAQSQPTQQDYFQDEQGNVYHRDELDWGNEPSYLNNAWQSLKASLTSLGSAVPGTMGVIGEGISELPMMYERFGAVMGGMGNPLGQSALFQRPQEPIQRSARQLKAYEGLGELGEVISEPMFEAQDFLQDTANSFREQRSEDPIGGADRTLRRLDTAVETGSKMFPALAAYAITKNPRALSAGIHGTILEPMSLNYRAAREAGFDRLESLQIMGTQAFPDLLENYATANLGGGLIKGGLTMGSAAFSGAAVDEAVQDLYIGPGAGNEKSISELDYESIRQRITDDADLIAIGAGSQFGTTRIGASAIDGTRAAYEAYRAKDKVAAMENIESIVEFEPIDTPELDAQIKGEKDPLIEKKVEPKERVQAVEGEIVKPEITDTSEQNFRKIEDLPKENQGQPIPEDPMLDVARMFDEVILEDARQQVEQALPDLPEPQFNPRLQELVTQQIIDAPTAQAVSQAIPDRVFGERATQMQVELMQKVGVATPTEVEVVGRQASVLEQIKRQLPIQTSSIDMAVRVREYQNVLSDFERKIGDSKNPFLAGMDTRKYKDAIRDESLASTGIHADAELLAALDTATDRKSMRRLARERIRGKKEGVLPTFDPDARIVEQLNLWDDEEGSIRFTPQKLAEKLRPNPISPDTETMLRDMESRPENQNQPKGIITKSYVPPIERFLLGKDPVTDSIPFQRVREAAEAINASTRKVWKQSKKVIDLGGPLYKQGFRHFERQQQEGAIRAQNTVLKEGGDYLDLADKNRTVNPILIKRQEIAEAAFREGRQAKFTDDTYKKMAASFGKELTPAELAAIKSWDAAMDKSWRGIVFHAKDRVRKSNLSEEDKAKRLTAVDEWAKIKQRTYYVPQARTEGKYAITGESLSTGDQFFDRYKSEAERNAVLERLKDMNYKAEGYEWQPPTEAAYALLPDDIMLDIERLIGSDIDVKKTFNKETGLEEVEQRGLKSKDPEKLAAGRGGFRSHLVKRQSVLGAPRNLEKQFLKYHEGAAQLQMKWKYQPKIHSIFEAIAAESTGGNPNVLSKSRGLQYMMDLDRYINANTNEGAAIRSLIGQHTLGADIPSVAINLTQNFTNGLPEMTREMGASKAGKALFVEAPVKYSHYVLRPESFKKKYPKLYSALEYSKAIGELGQTAVDFRGGGEVTGFEKWSQRTMIGQKLSEHYNRATMIIAAYENAHHARGSAKKMSHVDRLNFAIDMSKRSNVDYTKQARPLRARGGKSGIEALRPISYSMEMYGHNWTSNFLEVHRAVFSELGGVVKGDIGKGNNLKNNIAATAMYWATTPVMGGLKAMPFVPIAMQIAASMGYSAEDEFRKKTTELGLSHTIQNVMMYGAGMALPEALSFSLSGRLAPTQDLTYDRTLHSTIVNQVGGLPWNMLANKPVRYFTSAMQPERGFTDPMALSEIAPRAVAGPLRAYAYSQPNKLTGQPEFYNIHGDVTMKNPTGWDLAKEAINLQGGNKVVAQEKNHTNYLSNQRDRKRTEDFVRQLGNVLTRDGDPRKVIMDSLSKRFSTQGPAFQELGDAIVSQDPIRFQLAMEQAAAEGIPMEKITGAAIPLFRSIRQLPKSLLKKLDPEYRALSGASDVNRDEIERINRLGKDN